MMLDEKLLQFIHRGTSMSNFMASDSRGISRSRHLKTSNFVTNLMPIHAIVFEIQNLTVDLSDGMANHH